MRTSNDRMTNYSSLIFTPSITGQTPLIEGEASIKFITYTNTFSSFTLESANAYVASSSILSQRHQVSIGRRKFVWSETDEAWKLGLWTPRFTWEPFRPENLGLTGIFYTYDSKSFRVRLYGSPVSVPERGAPMVNDSNTGTLTFTSPWQRPLPTQIEVTGGRDATARYHLLMPELGDILFRPAGAIQLEVGEARRGGWARFNAGFMAIHQPDLMVDGGITAGTPYADLDVHPAFPMQRIATLEAGYRGSYWSLWASGTRQDPLRQAPPSNWFFNPMEAATIASAGVSLQAQGDLTVSGSLLAVIEDSDRAVRSDSTKSMNVPLDPRFLYRRAVQMGARWGHAESRLMYNLNWINDVENRNNWVSLDVNFAPWAHKAGKARMPLSFGLGADFFSASGSAGTLSKYQGNDQVRGRVSYVF